jgi:hypothetical protein
MHYAFSIVVQLLLIYYSACTNDNTTLLLLQHTPLPAAADYLLRAAANATTANATAAC